MNSSMIKMSLSHSFRGLNDMRPLLSSQYKGSRLSFFMYGASQCNPVQPGATPVSRHGNNGLPGRFDPHIW